MKSSLTLLSYLAATAALFAQPAPGLKTLGVGEVKPTPAIVESVRVKGLSNSLDRVTQSLDSQLINAFLQGRKFEVIARSDLAGLLKEADFSQGKFQIKSVNYLVLSTVDDFQDYQETRTFAAMGKTVTTRVIRLAAVCKLYDAGSGKLLESTNFEVLQREQNDVSGASSKNGDLTDQYLRGVSEEMAGKIVNRVNDVVFPLRIVSRMDAQVTLNRGDGSALAVGQVWNVFAQGKELIDPDTGASLGKEELNVGKVRITQINPKTSTGEIIEDHGVDRLAVLRPAAK